MKNSLKISFVVVAFFFVNFIHANVQPALNTHTLSFTKVILAGGWGNQVDRVVTIGANSGIVDVTIMKNGVSIDIFSFAAPGEYAYYAPTAWKGEYTFIIENQDNTTKFVAQF